MKVPLKWLNEFVSLDGISPPELAARMIAVGVAVENIEERNPGGALRGVVVGKIVELGPHPNADRLKISQVEIGDGKRLQIVTGAPNVKHGDVIPVALEGACLAGGLKIKKSNLRGQPSEGMMCSADELALVIKDLPADQREGVLIFPSDTPLGADVLDLLAINEVVFTLEPFANRADYLSIIGVAREVAAALGRPLKPLDTAFAENDPDATGFIRVSIAEPALCQLYTARVIDGVNVGSSPLWMMGRLHAAGIRSVNNVVDITNYVMLETGQPLHAFDYARLKGATIQVRPAHPGEKMESIDGVLRELDPNMLVIADAERPVAIAGVMGGLDSEVSESTTTVLLESANFHPVSVRRTSTRLALRSESSRRFEKGLDYYNADLASRRAAALMARLGGGSVARGHVQAGVEPPPSQQVWLRPERVNRILGSSLSASRMYRILESLQFNIAELQDGRARVTVPSFRLDVRREEDLAEEIARHYGYDNIPATLPLGRTPDGRTSERDRGEERVRDILVALGLHEAITLSLLHSSAYQRILWESEDGIEVKNPLVADQSALRTTLLPHLLQAATHNLRSRARSVRLFEISKIYTSRGNGRYTTSRGSLPHESRHLGIVLAGELPPSPPSPGSNVPFFHLKGIVEELLSHLGVPSSWEPPTSLQHTLHPGKSALVRSGDATLGWVGTLHPQVLEKLDTNAEIVAAELDLDLLLEAAGGDPVRFKPIPRFPEVERDLALVVAAHITSGQIEQVMRSAAGDHLVTLRCFDVYHGSQIPSGHKSLAYSLTFQAKDRTLTDGDIEKSMTDILRKVGDVYNAKVRT